MSCWFLRRTPGAVFLKFFDGGFDERSPRSRQPRHGSARHRSVPNRNRASATSMPLRCSGDQQTRKQGGSPLVSMAKVAVPRVALNVIDRAIRVHGGAGVSDDVPLTAMYGWHRAMRIFDGPDEVHLRTIARLEIRREPVLHSLVVRGCIACELGSNSFHTQSRVFVPASAYAPARSHQINCAYVGPSPPEPARRRCLKVNCPRVSRSRRP